MKQLLLLSVITGLLLFACSDQDSMVGPLYPDSNNPSQTMSEPTWLELPGASITRLYKSFSVSGLITPNSAASLVINERYEGGPHGTVDVFAAISFPAGSVDEDVVVTMELDADNAVFDFSPSMVFNKDAKLTVSLAGLGLDGVDPSEINFVYYAANGSLETVQSSAIHVDTETGQLSVSNVKISHFSRFGFVR